MKLIEKIEIHRFRSISDASIETENITIFSGVNNSGKSNVLRALNLFFNSETSFDHKYNFEKDYNYAFTGQAGGKRIIKVTLHFGKQGNAALSKPFSISRSFEDGFIGSYEYHSTDPVVQKALDKDDGRTRRQFTIFLSKIEYFYIPAVRDRRFVSSLFLNFEKLIEDSKDGEFEGKMEELSDIISRKSLELSRDFENFIGLPTDALLSSKITDILGTVEVMVGSGITVQRRLKGVTKPEEIKVSLFSSGDGILMSYLAYFLAHICKKLKNKKFIWGFEEPENSLEYSKVQRLAKEFSSEFIKDAQIFLTTHSPAFISLKDDPGCVFYRVYVKPGDSRRSSEIRTISVLHQRQQRLFHNYGPESKEYEIIQKELNMVELAAEIEQATEALLKERQEYIDKKDDYMRKSSDLLAQTPQKIFISEDSDRKILQLWEKWLRFYGLDDVKVISSMGSTNDFVENGIAYQMHLKSGYAPKVFREIDKDGLTTTQMGAVEQYLIKKYESKLNYRIKFLPVNEIENFAVINNPIFDDEFWEEHSQAIANKFDVTAESNCKRFDKMFNYSKEAGFRTVNGNQMAIVQSMRAEALTNWRRKMPGKDICALKNDFGYKAYLNSLTKENLPIELQDYLQEIKLFFDND